MPKQQPPSNTAGFSDEAVQKKLFKWWAGLDHHRGERAQLRRARSIDDVLLTRAFHRARKTLIGAGLPNDGFTNEQLALVIGLLAHVEEHAPEVESLPEQMGMPSKAGSRAPVNETRFRRLLHTESREGLYEPMRRVVGMLGQRTNVFRLASDLFYWGHQKRKHWAERYYEQAVQAENVG